MHWPSRRSCLILFMPLVAVACRVYSDELLDYRVVDDKARDSGSAVRDVGIPVDAPSACLPGNLDCSSACGDGVVDAERGETCEPNTETPCPTRMGDCDDNDPCTTDRLLGSALTCSALCVHVPKTVREVSDGCCPPGANDTQDPDCSAPCGDCDSGTDMHPPGADDADAGPPDAFCAADLTLSGCQRCSCDRCLDTYLACRQGSSAEENALCSAVLDCAERARCTADTCYCGSAPTIPACLIPSGPCMREIEMAAGTTDSTTIRSVSRDPATPLGRATAAGMCRVSECNGACFGAR